mgnify:CR=1 FL=1|tara:strand:- start:509 stop:850 length:342 start_codon:yes stop_codon:yes gene_type:complete
MKNSKKIKEIINEEMERIIEASMTKGFKKAIEAYQDVQLKQQKLRKAFVAEKNPKKREQLKQALIKMHKIVKKAESDFNAALMQEPVDLDENASYYLDKKKDKIMKFRKQKGE